MHWGMRSVLKLCPASWLHSGRPDWAGCWISWSLGNIIRHCWIHHLPIELFYFTIWMVQCNAFHGVGGEVIVIINVFILCCLIFCAISRFFIWICNIFQIKSGVLWLLDYLSATSNVFLLNCEVDLLAQLLQCWLHINMQF